MTGVRLTRLFWFGAATILIVAALIAVSAVLRGDFGETEAKILATLLVLLVAGATAISGLALIERGTAGILGGAAIAGATVCFALLTAAIWNEFASDTLGKLAASAIPVLISFLLLSTQRLVLRVDRLAPVFYGTAVAAALACALTLAVILADRNGGVGDDVIVEPIAILWILTALGYLLLPVLQRFTSAGAPATAERVLGSLDGVELVASRGRVDGIAVEPPSSGEQLVLRRGS